MDNLKFQAIKSQDYITITTETRTGDRYMGMIVDFDDVQYPDSILKDSVCEERIFANIKDTTYNVNDGEITVCIPLITGYSAVLELKLVETELKSQIDENNLVEKIVHRLSERLEPYEVIESFTYPQWKYIEEFEDRNIHENYKYILASQEPEKHLTPLKGTDKNYMAEFMNSYVMIHGWENGEPNSFYGGGEIHLISDCKLTNESTPREKFLSMFSESCKEFAGTYESGGVGISYKLLQYINKCVQGWILLNPMYVILRDPKVRITIESDCVKFDILRLKQRRYFRQWDNDYFKQNGPRDSKVERVCTNKSKNTEFKNLYRMPRLRWKVIVEDVLFKDY